MGLIYDVGLTDGGDLPAFTRHITGADLVKQRIRTRLGTFLGEWILDKDQGLPFVEWRAQKPPDVDGIVAVIRVEIEDTPGVLRVSELTGSLDRDTREITITGTVILEEDAQTGLPVTIRTVTRDNHMPALVFFGRPTAILGL